ncbi:MAG: response regulator [Victivallales bacterium]|nr:response regulator [Victivallales bacterium]
MTEEQRKKYKILLVDDDKLVRFTLSAFFRQTNYNVTALCSPQEGIELLKQETFDVVISDVVMEPIDGFLFRQMIREHLPDLPIIFLTSLVNGLDNALLAQVMEDTYSYYVPKNTSKQFLLGKLDQVLQFSGAKREMKEIRLQNEENQMLASEVQNAFLPPWTSIEEKYQISWLYKPLGKISGDLFEWLPVNDHSVLAVFGDVAGHGTHSALGMMAIQAFLKQMAFYTEEKICKPHEIAQEINDFISQYLSGRVYMCGLILYWNLDTNVMRMHNAGFLDMTSFDIQDGKRKDLNPSHLGSLPMGMMKQTVYREADTVEYIGNDNEVYIVASDGLMDLSRTESGEEAVDHSFFNDLLSILVKDVADEKNIIALPYKCYESLDQFGYHYPQDDVSLIALFKPKIEDKNARIFISRVNPNIEDVDKVSIRVADFLMGLNMPMEFSTKVELLLEEHLVNIIEHGMSEYHTKNDFIMIKLDCQESGLVLTVWDRGKEWNTAMFDRSSKPDRALEFLNSQHASSGRGVLIMRKIAPKITHERHCGMNETAFHIPYTDGTESSDAS